MSLRERKIEKDIKARQNVEKKMAAEEQKRKEAEEYRRKEKERRASLTPQERKEEDKKRRKKKAIGWSIFAVIILIIGIVIFVNGPKWEEEDRQQQAAEQVKIDNASKDLRNYCRRAYGGESGKPMDELLPYEYMISKLGFINRYTVEMRLQIGHDTDKDIAEYAADNFGRLIGCGYKPKDPDFSLMDVEVTDGSGNFMARAPFRDCHGQPL